MHKFLYGLGLYLVAAGISGAIDHVAVQPILGTIMNAFNRYVIPHVDALRGYEIAANLAVSVVGVVLVLATWKQGRSVTARA